MYNPWQEEQAVEEIQEALVSRLRDKGLAPVHIRGIMRDVENALTDNGDMSAPPGNALGGLSARSNSV